LLKKIIISLFCLNSIIDANLLDDAKKELEKNNVSHAITLLKKSARQGEDEANFELGKIYYLNTYGKRNLSLAFNYFKKAANYEHKKAKYNLAVIYSQKKFKNYDLKEAYRLFLSLAREGSANAQYMVGIYLINGFGVDKDYSLAKKWLEEAYFKNNYEEASCGIAYIYANGLGVLQNLGRARKFSENFQNKFSLCKSTFLDFKLYKKKYEKDKGFKFGYYR